MTHFHYESLLSYSLIHTCMQSKFPHSIQQPFLAFLNFFSQWLTFMSWSVLVCVLQWGIISVLLVSLMWSPPYQPVNSQPPRPPPLQLSLHLVLLPHHKKIFSEDKLPNTYTHSYTQNTTTHSKCTINPATYKSHQTQVWAVFDIHRCACTQTHTHTQFYLLIHRLHCLAANKGDKYPLTLPPKPQTLLQHYTHSSIKTSPHHTQNTERGAQDMGDPPNSVSTWSSPLPPKQ